MTNPIDDIDAQEADLAARETAATLSPEEEVRAAKLAAFADRKAALAVTERRKRALLGAIAEASAKKDAGGRYLVKFVDLGTILADADPSTLPGEGVLVIRSPPTEPIDVLAQFTREHEANERPLPDLMIDMLLPSIVRPETSLVTEEGRLAGMKLRNFFESTIGKGAAITVGNEVSRLGGMRAAQVKRGRGQ